METSHPQFGLIVAYLLPGFIGLGGIMQLVPAVGQWLQPVAYQGAAGIAPPIYAVLAATGIGMILSCFRWILIDHLHHRTGVPLPHWDVNRLEHRLRAFNQLVEYHYRYHQFYANMLIGVLFTYSLNRVLRTSSLLGLGTDLGVLIVCAALFAGSRDALTKYSVRTTQLIGHIAEKDNSGDPMTNGCHHEQGGCATTKKDPAPQQQSKSNSQTQPQQPVQGNQSPSSK